MCYIYGNQLWPFSKLPELFTAIHLHFKVERGTVRVQWFAKEDSIRTWEGLRNPHLLNSGGFHY